jgi:hypothetical protein
MNWAEHVKNRNAFPLEELEKYEGQHVAWNLDGTRILAGHEDPLRLNAALEAAGYRPDDYVLSFVEFESHLGGAALGDAVWERVE